MGTFATVQSAVGDNGTGANTVTATWPATTKQGNMLIAVVAYNMAGADTSIAAPTGWDSLNGDTNNGTLVEIETFACNPANAAARSGAETFTLSVSKKAAVVIAEVSGMPSQFRSLIYQLPGGGGTGATSGSGTSTTASNTAGSPSLTQHASCVLVGIGCVNVVTFSAPTSPYVLVNQTSSSGGGAGDSKVSVGLLYGEQEGIGTAMACSVTLSASQAWAFQMFDCGREPPPKALLGVGW